jgi:simple sugar transport system permease protein
MDIAPIAIIATVTAILNSAVRLAIPVALAGAGEAISEKAGVLNLGLEGVMLGGALGGFMGAFYSGDPWVGLAVGLTAGVAVAILMAYLSVTLKTDQVINGIAIVLLLEGLTTHIYGRSFGSTLTPPQTEAPAPVDLGPLSELPIVGPVLFHQTALVYVSVLLIGAAWWVLYRTRFGLYVRAVGEDPSAATAAGVNVDLIRWGAVLLCGAFAGVGGAVLVVGQLQHFQANITAGQGWIAIALVILGRRNPVLVGFAALGLGIAQAFQLSIQASQGGLGAAVPYEFFAALPYILAILAMLVAGEGRQAAQPAALGIPYRKEERTSTNDV